MTSEAALQQALGDRARAPADANDDASRRGAPKTSSGGPRRPRLTLAGALCLLLSLWGCLAIHNATYFLEPAYGFASRQLVWVGLGAVALIVASGYRDRHYRRLTLWFAATTYLSLWLVLLYGIRINGMRGWFSWHGLFFQPSELAKPAFVLSLALLFSRTHRHRTSWLRGFLPALALFCVWVIPIALQPDFGAVAVYAFTFAVLYWCVRGCARHLLAAALAAVPILVLLCWQHPYLVDRVVAFLNPAAHGRAAGWHIIQFQQALAAGGPFGRSWGSGMWSRAYLPLGYSDSIFASTAEAVGLVGVLPIILMVVAWVAYGHFRATRLRNPFAAAAVFGLVIMLAGQAFVHLSVNLGLLPPTGITLPLISYGGSSLLSTLLTVGIIEGMVAQPHPASLTPAPSPVAADQMPRQA